MLAPRAELPLGSVASCVADEQSGRVSSSGDGVQPLSESDDPGRTRLRVRFGLRGVALDPDALTAATGCGRKAWWRAVKRGGP